MEAPTHEREATAETEEAKEVNITIKVIPNEQQRACVDGCDWYWDENGDLQVRVSPLSDWRHEVLLGIHEAVEAVMCRHDGVTQEQVDAFDVEYDKAHAVDINAGDDPNAPYKKQHTFATAIERILAGALSVDWKTYDDEIQKSYPGPSKKK